MANRPGRWPRLPVTWDGAPPQSLDCFNVDSSN